MTVTKYHDVNTDETNLSTNPPSPKEDTKDEQIANVTSYINDRLHQPGKDVISKFTNNPQECSTQSFEELLTKLDPVLVKFVQMMTQSVRARRK